MNCRARDAACYQSWTLDDVLLSPIVSPHGRSNRTNDAIEEGLSVFHHYQKEFALFHGRELVWDKQSESLVSFDKQIKVTCFVSGFGGKESSVGPSNVPRHFAHPLFGTLTELSPSDMPIGSHKKAAPHLKSREC